MRREETSVACELEDAGRREREMKREMRKDERKGQHAVRLSAAWS